MAAKQPKRASGPTQTEKARTRKQVLLRLTPHVAGILRAEAAEQGIPVSGLVAELVTRTWGHLYEAADHDRSKANG